MNVLQRGALLGLMLSLLSLPSRAARAAGPINVDVQPLLGVGSPAVDGWNSAYVRIDNASPQPLRGKIVVSAGAAWAHAGPRNITEMPFSVAARGQVAMEVPVHGMPGMPPSLKLQALSDEGELLAEAKSGELRGVDPLIFDLGSPSHVAPALRLLAVPLRHTRYGTLGTPLLSVSSARQQPRSGEPLVPRLASGYASVTLVLATGPQLAQLDDEALAALSDWVLAGGALALSVERPEDLRAPFVQAWVGGAISEAPASEELRAEAIFPVPLEQEGAPGGSSPVPQGGIAELRIEPSRESREKLKGFAGANLRPSPWGASASYGLGEVHLLAFRPNAEPFVSDPWSHRKLADLTRHAWERDAAVALPHAEATLDDSRLRLVRRELDPNQGTRWTIIVSALLLLVYAGVAGPLNFYLARRAQSPLRALLLLPVFASLTLALVVLLGIASRGVTGRARHLTLIEAGAGMQRAAVTRFRALYASSSAALTVQSSARGNVLDVTGDVDETGRRLVVDREGARLTNLRGRPWEVVLVREDGFVGMGGGLSVLTRPDGTITLTNRLGRDLLGVVLLPPGTRSARFYARLADGATVDENSGKTLTFTRTRSLGRSALGLELEKTTLEAAAKGLTAAWEAIEGATTRSVDFWPDDVPVVVAQLDGGEGKLTDSGLPLEADRTLLRVVGTGGVP